MSRHSGPATTVCVSTSNPPPELRLCDRLTLYCLDSIADLLADDAVVREGSASEVGLVAMTERFGQSRSFPMNDGAIAFCGRN